MKRQREQNSEDVQTLDPSHWQLRLYVAGQTPKSVAAFSNLKSLCEEHLAGRYEKSLTCWRTPNWLGAIRSSPSQLSCASCRSRSARSSGIYQTRNVSSSDFSCALSLPK
jgi:hypothetical protein